MTDKQTPPDWVLIEAAKLCLEPEKAPDKLREIHGAVMSFRALCDMIERYEQPPVDRKLLCAREAMVELGFIPDGGAVKGAIRAIEQHEAFRQEVSDALEKRGFYIDDRDLGRFIIAKPDPLVEVLDTLGWSFDDTGPDMADDLRAAIEKRGGKIVWGEG